MNKNAVFSALAGYVEQLGWDWTESRVGHHILSQSCD